MESVAVLLAVITGAKLASDKINDANEDDDEDRNESAKGDNDPPKIEEAKQGKHIPGHNNHTPGRSELDDLDPQKLIDNHAGKGEQVGKLPVGEPGSKERVDFGKVIGKYVDPITGDKVPTTKGIIHYGKKGVHIVPSRP
ncbi:polymorphic toxin type 50 domain-containing protein [Pseudovibrio sp. Tun.PSC04-5.I4]|uniref:polymorphic toxin type 50 domain-containing protein n=1 Tax=Pseudovibrio sp. Tun.PSC04-5.I4 TaxID=1798213 RepID=UPI000883CE82|nr:polymorphic toxin type 50 domain-containing protein [Pseudovibrio sp. Tun.PSC04-5.I4]SDR45760.1 toxin 50 [Pseudovibrio sp. Tun.PSC04-5.I4]